MWGHNIFSSYRGGGTGAATPVISSALIGAFVLSGPFASGFQGMLGEQAEERTARSKEADNDESTCRRFCRGERHAARL